MIGVYAVVNKLTNQAYVGSSANVARRLTLHRSAIKTGKFYQKQCYAKDALKYGFGAFDFRLLKTTETIEEAKELETAFLEIFIDDLYNKAPHANGSTGVKRNPVKYKSGAAKRNADPEYAAKLSLACKGKRQIVKCPHCGLEGGDGNMRRYHFNKCNKR